MFDVPENSPLMQTRGITNNNPGNLRGEYFGAVGSDGSFAIYDSPEAGIAAIPKQLKRYFEGKTTGTPLKTVRDIISTYAPSSENNTEAYVKSVASRIGRDADEELDLKNPKTMLKLTQAIIHHENGGNPYNPAVVKASVEGALPGFTTARKANPSSEEGTENMNGNPFAFLAANGIMGERLPQLPNPNGSYDIGGSYNPAMPNAVLNPGAQALPGVVDANAQTMPGYVPGDASSQKAVLDQAMQEQANPEALLAQSAGLTPQQPVPSVISNATPQGEDMHVPKVDAADLTSEGNRRDQVPGAIQKEGRWDKFKRRFMAGDPTVVQGLAAIGSGLSLGRNWSEGIGLTAKGISGVSERAARNNTLLQKAQLAGRTKGQAQKGEIMYGLDGTVYEQIFDKRSGKYHYRNAQTGAVSSTLPKGAAPKQPGGPLTKGQEAVDKKFADDHVKWMTGGAADFKKVSGQLDQALNNLKNSPDGEITGPLIGSLPVEVRPYFSQKSTNTEELVQEVVQRNLKAVLGGQFSEKEGERLIKRAYNPKLSQKMNAQRVQRLLTAINEGGKQKAMASEYFQARGTLRGFQGSQKWTLADIEEAAKLGREERGSSSSPAQAKTNSKTSTGVGWRVK